MSEKERCGNCPVAPPPEEKPTHCRNCGAEFGQFQVQPCTHPRGLAEGLCEHCGLHVPTCNIIARPPLAEDFEAKYVTRERHEAELAYEGQAAERMILALKAENATLQSDNAKMVPLWDAVHRLAYGGDKYRAADLRAAACALSDPNYTCAQMTIRRIADALDPPAEEPADEPPNAVHCLDCGNVVSEQPATSVVWYCPDCKAKREAEERFRPVKCSGCGVEGLLRPLPGGLAPAPWECSDCFAKRMAEKAAALEAEDAERRLRERGERVKAALKPGDPVMINKVQRSIEGTPWSDDNQIPERGQLAVCVAVSSRNYVDIHCANGVVHGLYAHNLTPWGADGPLPGFGEEDE